jgi:hypothetical protein
LGPDGVKPGNWNWFGRYFPVRVDQTGCHRVEHTASRDRGEMVAGNRWLTTWEDADQLKWKKTRNRHYAV